MQQQYPRGTYVRKSFLDAKARIQASAKPKRRVPIKKPTPQKKKTIVRARSTSVASKRRAPSSVASKSKSKEYFLRPNSISNDTRKYCRCLAEVGAKQSDDCLRGKSKETIGKGCYNPYAICGRIRPAGMRGGCAMLYDYKNMPQPLVQSTAAMHNKTIKELVAAAKDEAARMKYD